MATSNASKNSIEVQAKQTFIAVPLNLHEILAFLSSQNVALSAEIERNTKEVVELGKLAGQDVVDIEITENEKEIFVLFIVDFDEKSSSAAEVQSRIQDKEIFELLHAAKGADNSKITLKQQVVYQEMKKEQTKTSAKAKAKVEADPQPNPEPTIESGPDEEVVNDKSQMWVGIGKVASGLAVMGLGSVLLFKAIVGARTA